MNRHQEVWIDGVEYDLVHILRSTYWEVILVSIDLVSIEPPKIVAHLGTVPIG